MKEEKEEKLMCVAEKKPKISSENTERSSS